MSRRIAFLLPDLRGGGTERLTVDLIDGCIARGYAADLVLLRRRGALLDALPEGVRITDLAADRLRDAMPPLRRYLKRVRPDGLIAAMWPLTVIAIASAAGLRPRPRIVVSEHSALGCEYARRPAFLAMAASMRMTYRFAAGVVGVSGSVSNEVAGLASLPQSRVTTIYNPVGHPREAGASPWAGAVGKRILSVGALKRVKNHQLLVRAFAELAAVEEATLAIVGEGTERAALEAQVARAGLQGRILLPGFTLTPGDWYRGADLFVLSSDNEGFGNVLVEAMHHGLPIVATDCQGGPSEVLGGGRWGHLVPPGDAAALADAMRATLKAPKVANEQKDRAAAFGVDRAVNAYLDLMFAGC